MGLSIGIKTDLKRYDEYYSLFSDTAGKPCDAIEFHLGDKDIEHPVELKKRICSAYSFIQENRIKNVAFHYPRLMLPSDIAWLHVAQISAEHPHTEKQLYKMASDTISTLAECPVRPVMIIHQETYIPDDGAKRDLFSLRRHIERAFFSVYQHLLNECDGLVTLGLENMPPIIDRDGQGSLFGQALEHLEDRLSLGGVYVMDVAHASMSIYHKHIDHHHKLKTMDSVDSEQCKSLRSMQDHILEARNCVGWMHLADAKPNDDGTLSAFFEGCPIGIEGSMMPVVMGLKKNEVDHGWRLFFSEVRKNIKDAKMVLEISGAHMCYDYIADSYRYLRGIGVFDGD